MSELKPFDEDIVSLMMQETWSEDDIIWFAESLQSSRDCIIQLRAELDDCKKWKDITASNHNHLRQQVIDHLAEIRQLRQALEELFTAYQTLDEETRPADVLPLELIQDIMPQIEQALKGGE